MRPIDADALVEAIKDYPYGFRGMIVCDIAKQPTIDAVPVVRCKDCKHYEFADNRAFGMPVKRCEWTGFEDVDDNDFCSRGERNEDANG